MRKQSLRKQLGLASFFLVLSLCMTTVLTDYPPEYGPKPISASKLTAEILQNPKADAYDLLSYKERMRDWAKSSKDLDTLQELSENIMTEHEWLDISIKLIGFDSDVYRSLNISQTALSSYLDTLLGHEDEVEVIHPSNGEHLLPIKKKIMPQVYKDRTLLASLRDKRDSLIAEKSRLQQNSSTNFITSEGHEDNTKRYYLIDPEPITEILNKDFASSHQPFTIYIINLPTLPNAGERYMYSSPNDKVQCGSPHWIAGKRFAWLDISAGPIYYRPTIMSAAIVSPPFVPNIHSYRDHNDYSVVSSGKLIVDLVAYIRRTLDYVISPSVDRIPLFTPGMILRIKLYRIVSYDKTNKQFFSFETIKQLLREMPTFKGQELLFEEEEIILDNEPFLLYAFYDSLRIQVEEADSSARYYSLDSSLLHFRLQQYHQVFENKRRLSKKVSNREKIFPVFLYDLSGYDEVLLDRNHQSVAFDDMVISTQATAAESSNDWECGGKPLTWDSRDATRATLSALLQTIWGIPPINQKWSVESQLLEVNNIWSVGWTPNSLFTGLARLSFVQTDAAARNIIYAEMMATVKKLKSLFSHFPFMGQKELEEIMTENYFEFLVRWNIFQWKLDESRNYLSLRNFNASLNMLLSTQPDLDRIHTMVHETAPKFHSVLRCKKRILGNNKQNLSLNMIGGLVSLGLAGFVGAYYLTRFTSLKKLSKRKIK